MDAFPYLFQTSTLLLILSVGYYLLLRRETFFQANRLVLWFSLLGALLLPLLELPDFRPAKLRALEATIRQQLSRAELPGDSEARLASPIEKLTIAPPTRQVPIMNLPPGNKPQVQLDTLAVPASPTNWIILLVSLYYLVASGLLIRFLMQLYSLFNLLRQSEQTDYEEFTLVTSPSINSPFSFFKWVALNPAQHTPDEQEQILRHERVHVRQWHSLDTLAAEVLCIFFWFNPGAWLFRRLVHQTLEYIADRAVLQEGIDARAYQYNLVKVTLSANSPTISNHFSRSELKDRIRMINRHRSGWRAAWRYGSLLALSCGLLVSWQCQFSNTAPTLPADMQSFVAKDGETIYWIVTPSMTETKLNKLSQALRSQHILFKPNAVHSKSGHLLRLEADLFKYSGSTYPASVLHEQAFTEAVLKKHNILHHEFISAGNSAKPSLLPALGFWYEPETGFHSDLVTNDFPKALQRQADKEGGPPIFLNRISQEDLKRLQEFENQTRPGVTRMKLKNFMRQPTKPLPEQYQNKTLDEVMAMISRDASCMSSTHIMDMNRLLEVSFMKYRQFMLHVTDDYHLDLLPEYRQATITIDGHPATLAQLRKVHVRQVERAHVHQKGEFERVFSPEPYDVKYSVTITRAPKRANRDSSYYVFSPFYSGDF